MDKLALINECFYKTLGAKEQYFDTEDLAWIGYNPFESFKDLLSAYNITLESYEGELGLNTYFVEFIIDKENYLSYIREYQDDYTGLIMLQYHALEKEEDFYK